MSLYEHIARSSQREGASKMPNPMNAMSSSDSPSRGKFLRLLILSQVFLFTLFGAYYGYGVLESWIEQRSAEKAEHLLVAKLSSMPSTKAKKRSRRNKHHGSHKSASQPLDAKHQKPKSSTEHVAATDKNILLASTIAHTGSVAQPSAKQLSDMKTVKKSTKPEIPQSVATKLPDSQPSPDATQLPHGSAMLSPVTPEKSQTRKQKDKDLEQTVTSAVSVGAVQPSSMQSRVDHKIAAQAVAAFVNPPAAQSRTDTELTGIVANQEKQPQKPQQGNLDRARVLWRDGISKQSPDLLQQALKLVGVLGFVDVFVGDLELLESSSWIEVVDFCQAGSRTLTDDSKQDKLVLRCADFLADKGRVSQAHALFTLRPHLPTHLDYYGRLAYLNIKMDAFEDAADVYKRLLQQDPKNAQWWLGLGWAYRAMGQDKAAQDAYTNAYQNALPNASYKPFLKSVLHYE